MSKLSVKPTDLKDNLITEISKSGPMNVDTYIQRCMFDHEFGYYNHSCIFGADGDFVTAPEISQLFGECIAIWMLTNWQKSGSPKRIRIIELGPGRGTLMFDILSLIDRAFPDILINSICVEPSPRLQETQKKKLNNYPCVWVNEITDVPTSSELTFVIANEVFDVLPIKQFIEGEERKIIYDNDLHFSNDGRVIEVSHESENLATNIQKLVTENGLALVIDYGDFCEDERFGDTLRAIQNHRGCDIFQTPGSCDISHQVDFFQLKTWTNGNHSSQRDFLMEYGIESRLKKLIEIAPEQEINLTQGVYRLINPSNMGERFHALVFGSLVKN